MLIYQTVSISLAPGGTYNNNVNVPQGYNVLKAIQFDPNLDLRLTVRSQKTKIEYMSGVTTKQGAGSPMLALNNPYQIDDRLLLTVVNKESGNVDTAISFVFSEA